jgi:hypothetical protein
MKDAKKSGLKHLQKQGLERISTVMNKKRSQSLKKKSNYQLVNQNYFLSLRSQNSGE